MKKLNFLILIFLFSSLPSAFAQTPEITSWIINTTGATGFNGIPSNVQVVQYSATQVYVSCTCIPGYSIGPWANNPNTAVNQNFVYKITRTPVQNTGTPVSTPMGHTGVWSNGVSIYNPKDGFSYNNQNIWNQNAVVFEGISFDACLGHPAPNGEYHHHLNPTCLYNDHDSSVHAPIIGYAFDGFPVYGAYGFVNTNGTGGITRMRSSWHVRNISNRTTLPNGTVLSPGQYGPAVSTTYPLGSYLEDYEFIPGSGDLDEHNGRFCVTPDYPAGIYAYFVTLDSVLAAAYPYTPGPTYYGTVQSGNTGPGSGHQVISEPTTVYTPLSGLDEMNADIQFLFFPNPVDGLASVYFLPDSRNNIHGRLCSMNGSVLQHFENFQPGVQYNLDFNNIAAGVYVLFFEAGNSKRVQRIVKL